jgi:hypothetical protein
VHQHRHHHHHHHHQLSSPCRRVRSVTQHIFLNSPAITLLWVWTRVGRWSCQCFGRGDVPIAVDTVRPQLEVRLSIPQCRPTRLRSTRTRTPFYPRGRRRWDGIGDEQTCAWVMISSDHAHAAPRQQ